MLIDGLSPVLLENTFNFAAPNRRIPEKMQKNPIETIVTTRKVVPALLTVGAMRLIVTINKLKKRGPYSLLPFLQHAASHSMWQTE